MSAERVDSLHQKASELYLSGDYENALATWQEVVALDPGHSEALEGIRMSGLLLGGVQKRVSTAENGDTWGGAEAQPLPKIGDLDPSLQGEGAEFGGIGAIPPAAVEPDTEAAAVDASLETMFRSEPDAVASPRAERESVGLTPAGPGGGANSGATAAA